MIIDLILNRKEDEESNQIGIAESKLDDLYVPVSSIYPKLKLPKELRNGYVYHYSPAGFYRAVMRYGEIGFGITAAMDYGTEADVKNALCEYIDRNEYNPDIKDYVNSVNWLEGVE